MIRIINNYVFFILIFSLIFSKEGPGKRYNEIYTISKKNTFF